MSSSPTDTATVEVTMPQMGVSVAEGTIVAWRVAVGEPIRADETICDISTDKIDTEVPSPATGVVTEILVGVDETVPVGAVLARISGEGATRAAAPAQAGAGAPADTAAEAPAHAGAGAPASAGAGAPADIGSAAGHPGTASTQAAVPADGRRYSPVVQRIAAEHGIDLAGVSGTGRGGRVRKQDVLAVVGAAPAAEEPPLHIESPYRPDPAPAAAAVVASEGLSRMRRSIGEHMKRSLEVAATCTTWIEADMSRVEAARARLKLTALPFVARATIAALRDYPALNAWLDGESYTRHDEAVHLGIAVSLGEEGLIVPVIHDAQQLSVEGLSARIRDLARRARAGELMPDEVRGGTFTITNPGQYGSVMATPIINQPQVAILDLEAVVKRPVVVTDADGNDSIVIRPMTILGLSWDHRALDGALSAQFLARVRENLEGLTAA